MTLVGLLAATGGAIPLAWQMGDRQAEEKQLQRELKKASTDHVVVPHDNVSTSAAPTEFEEPHFPAALFAEVWCPGVGSETDSFSANTSEGSCICVTNSSKPNPADFEWDAMEDHDDYATIHTSTLEGGQRSDRGPIRAEVSSSSSSASTSSSYREHVGYVQKEYCW